MIGDHNPFCGQGKYKRGTHFIEKTEIFGRWKKVPTHYWCININWTSIFWKGGKTTAYAVCYASIYVQMLIFNGHTMILVNQTKNMILPFLFHLLYFCWLDPFEFVMHFRLHANYYWWFKSRFLQWLVHFPEMMESINEIWTNGLTFQGFFFWWD